MLKIDQLIVTLSDAELSDAERAVTAELVRDAAKLFIGQGITPTHERIQGAVIGLQMASMTIPRPENDIMATLDIGFAIGHLVRAFIDLDEEKVVDITPAELSEVVVQLPPAA